MARKRFYPRSTRPLFPPSAAAPVVLTGWMNRGPVLPPAPVDTPRDFVVLRPFPPIAPPAVILTGWMERNPVLPPVPVETPRDFVVLRPFPPIAAAVIPKTAALAMFVRPPVHPEYRPELQIAGVGAYVPIVTQYCVLYEALTITPIGSGEYREEEIVPVVQYDGIVLRTNVVFRSVEVRPL